MFKRIFVPTDGSDLSTETVKRAVSFAQEAGAQLIFFYAMPEYPVAFYGEGALIDPTTPEKFAELAAGQANEILAACTNQARAANVTSETLTTVSDIPYQAIIDGANKVNADLIFMASHGRKGIGGMLLGSETQKVLTHSKIPVLVYR